jgi:arginyl-tRNA synthetase
MPPMTDSSTSNLHDPISILSQRFQAGIRLAFPELAGEVDPIITSAKSPQLGDFQSNAAMGLSKRVGKPPRDVALAIVQHVNIGDIAETLSPASVAGPGFINIRLRPDALASMLAAMDTPTLGVASASPPATIVVDLMGVNLAKQMHVGHLRSPFIGDAIARTLERLGHTVIRQNHVGDWGLNIAMVTARILRLSKQGKINIEKLTLDDLDQNYKAAQAECQRDAAGLATATKFGLGPKAIAELEEQVAGAEASFKEARDVLIKLQAKEPETYAMWKRLASITMGVALDAMKRLHVNVTDEHSAGESSYADELSPMVDDLTRRSIAVIDQGALVVKLDEPGTPWADRYGVIKEPCLIRKTDGGYLYATTDVAGIRRRVQKLGAQRVIYVIDARQNLHLRQAFAASLKAGYSINPKTHQPATLEHAAFGSVLGEDGRPFKTRSGDSVNLQSLIDEAVQRALVAVKSRNESAPDADLRATAEAIGVAAMKYADLSTDRVKDYVFSFDRMLAFEGNTGPYLLYALVRIKQIFVKARELGLAVPTHSRGTGVSPVPTSPTSSTSSLPSSPFSVAEPAEKQLALALLRYPAALQGVADALEPHRLCGYLYDLAGAFSAFYDQCPVLKADDATRAARLRQCDLTARVLADGLHTLGMPTVERM